MLADRWKMIVLGGLVFTAACQRPSQKLPPMPGLAMNRVPVAPLIVAPPPPVAIMREEPPKLDNSFDDFLKYAGTNKIYFAADSYDLDAQARQTLDKQAKWFVTHPSVAFVVEGHADENGTRDYNFALAERRAATIRSYFMVQGVSSERVKLVSYGSERPASNASDEQGWALSRRGEITFQGMAGK